MSIKHAAPLHSIYGLLAEADKTGYEIARHSADETVWTFFDTLHGDVQDTQNEILKDRLASKDKTQKERAHHLMQLLGSACKKADDAGQKRLANDIAMIRAAAATMQDRIEEGD